MARTQHKLFMVFAILLLTFGCALMVMLPQGQAHALKAGTTFQTATDATPKGKALLTKSGTIALNSNNDNNYFRFTTSNRNSRYKLTIAGVDGDRFYITVYDKTFHRIAHMTTNKKSGQSWTFKNLKQGQIYYIEVWRYTLQMANYLDSGSTLGVGYAEKNNARYSLKLKEVITKPGDISKLRIKSTKSNVIRVAYNEAVDADGYRIEVKKQGDSSWVYIPGYFIKGDKTSYVITKLRTTTKTGITLNASSKYKVRVRAWRKVNGKYYHGKWATTSASIKPNGKVTSWKY